MAPATGMRTQCWHEFARSSALKGAGVSFILTHHAFVMTGLCCCCQHICYGGQDAMLCLDRSALMASCWQRHQTHTEGQMMHALSVSDSLSSVMTVGASSMSVQTSMLANVRI